MVGSLLWWKTCKTKKEKKKREEVDDKEEVSGRLRWKSERERWKEKRIKKMEKKERRFAMVEDVKKKERLHKRKGKKLVVGLGGRVEERGGQ